MYIIKIELHLKLPNLFSGALATLCFKLALCEPVVDTQNLSSKD